MMGLLLFIYCIIVHGILYVQTSEFHILIHYIYHSTMVLTYTFLHDPNPMFSFLPASNVDLEAESAQEPS